MTLPLTVQKMIDDTIQQCDDIMLAYSSLIRTGEVNTAIARKHGTANEAIQADIASICTDLRLLSLVFKTRHRNSANTAMEDMNNSIKLNKFVQALEDMKAYYHE